MCGRFVRFTSPETFAELFGAHGTLDLAPSYNVAPSQPLLVVRNADDAGRELALLRWGLVPSWSKTSKAGYSTINARAETVATKPSFLNAFRRRRCLIAADGYYEWKRTGGLKQPYFIRLQGGQPFAMAGLWEHWEGEGQLIESCTIIVTEANPLTKHIHDRMPVLLSPEHYDLWMDGTERDPERLQEVLRPYPAAAMEAYPVESLVNNPRNNTARLIARA